MKKIKIIAVTFSYLFLVFLIFLSYNLIVPQDEIPEISNNFDLVKEIVNDYRPNEDSVYEIIEKKDINEIVNKKAEKNLEEIPENKNLNESVNKGKKYRIQLASFKNEKKSRNVAIKLQKHLSELLDNSELEIKKFNHSSNEIFYRILSSKVFSHKKAKNICKKINEKKIDCIIIRDEPSPQNT